MGNIWLLDAFGVSWRGCGPSREKHQVKSIRSPVSPSPIPHPAVDFPFDFDRFARAVRPRRPRRRSLATRQNIAGGKKRIEFCDFEAYFRVKAE